MPNYAQISENGTNIYTGLTNIYLTRCLQKPRAGLRLSNEIDGENHLVMRMQIIEMVTEDATYLAFYYNIFHIQC